MAYTTINKSTDYFNTKLYTGDGGTNALTGVGFQPDWVWIKNRTSGQDHQIYDAVRGVNKKLESNNTDAEATLGGGLQAFGTDGFTLGDHNESNDNADNYASWNWKAGGTAPSQTYVVKVVSDSGNKYRFDDFGTSAVTLDLQEGGTYTFDQSDSSNATHPLRFYTASDKSGGEYTTGVTTNGTPGSSGAYTRITVAASAPTLYYQCSSHAGMGGQVNTNSTFGSSNFSGSVQSTVSANTTAGFSIVTWTSLATGSNYTVGHGLGSTPAMIILKGRHESNNWMVYHHKNTSAPETDYLVLDEDGATSDYPIWNDTAPTSSVFTCGTWSGFDAGGTMVAYCFAEKTGYSKFGSYTANANADGAFVYTGFKPAWVIIKQNTNNSRNWVIQDNKRSIAGGANPNDDWLYANASDAEYDASSFPLDLVSMDLKLDIVMVVIKMNLVELHILTWHLVNH